MPVWGELITSGRRELGVHQLQNSTIVIGRSSKADIKVTHHQISAQHCQLIYNERTNRVVCVDKSSNGTLLRLNGVNRKMTRNTEYEINDSDAVILVKTLTPEKADELWFEFRRVIHTSSVSPGGRENIIPVVPMKEVKPSTAPAPAPPANIEEDHAAKDVPMPPPPLSREETTASASTIAYSVRSAPSQSSAAEEINDSIESDLPDFDDVLRTTFHYVPPTVAKPKKSEVTVAVKVVPSSTKRPASSNDKGGSSAAKKPSIFSSTATTTDLISSVTTSSAAFSLDDSDDLADIIPDFKAPPSVSEIRAKPAIQPMVKTSTQPVNKASAPPAMSAADRARKLLASALPADFLQTETGSVSSETPAADSAPSSEAAKPSTSSTASAPSSSGGNMEENLMCTICQELFHDPVNVVPCNHVFCGGCLSLWLSKSKDCPQCRTVVEKCTEHHLIKNLTESFLESHPDRKRTPEEIAELDKQNTITKNKKPSPGKGRGRGAPANQGGIAGFLGGFFAGAGAGAHAEQNYSDYGDEDDDEVGYYDSSDYGDDDDDDGDDGYDNGGGYNAGNFGNLQYLLNIFSGARGAVRGARGGRGGAGRGAARGGSHATSAAAAWGIVCRQCPGGSLAVAPTTAGRGRARGRGRGSASSGNGNIPVPAAVVPFTCTANNHVICRCCTERFPNRDQPGIPPIRCSLCQGTYCHLYWGCKAPGCPGCLGALNAFTATTHELEGGIAMQTNTVEAGFFATYLAEKSVSPQSVLQIGYQLLDLNAMPELNGATPQSPVCRLCFKNKVIPAIAYAYRAQLTSSDLPAAVASRPNCEWGKDCRTQKRSVAHSRKHNHICQPSGNNNGAGTSQ